MFKRLLERFQQDRGLHKATVRIEFFSQNRVSPQIFWLRSGDPPADTVALIIFFYGRILFELAEMNEVRVARELMNFLDQVCQLVLTGSGASRSLRLPLGELRLAEETVAPAVRTYQAEFYEFQDGSYRLEYQGSIGKESFYLPGAFLALMQYCLDKLEEESRRQVARAIGRLHAYYRLRRDFWDIGALVSGPVFALGQKELSSEEAAAEV